MFALSSIIKEFKLRYIKDLQTASIPIKHLSFEVSKLFKFSDIKERK